MEVGAGAVGPGPLSARVPLAAAGRARGAEGGRAATNARYLRAFVLGPQLAEGPGLAAVGGEAGEALPPGHG